MNLESFLKSALFSDPCETEAGCYQKLQVIDDESDYFSLDSNQWLTADQREALTKREQQIREEKYGSRLNRKITFDFAGN